MYRESLVDNVGSQDLMTCQLSDLSCDDDQQPDLCRCEHSLTPLSPCPLPRASTPSRAGGSKHSYLTGQTAGDRTLKLAWVVPRVASVNVARE